MCSQGYAAGDVPTQCISALQNVHSKMQQFGVKYYIFTKQCKATQIIDLYYVICIPIIHGVYLRSSPAHTYSEYKRWKFKKCLNDLGL